MLVLATVTEYLEYVFQLDDTSKENVKTSIVKHVVDVRHAFSQTVPSTLVMGGEYLALRREFEAVFTRVWPNGITFPTPSVTSDAKETMYSG